jgi:hypothetical protein
MCPNRSRHISWQKVRSESASYGLGRDLSLGLRFFIVIQQYPRADQMQLKSKFICSYLRSAAAFSAELA